MPMAIIKATTTNIMPTSGQSGARAHSQQGWKARRCASLALISLAGACVVLAITMLPMRLQQLAGNDFRAALADGKKIRGGDLDAFIANRKEALAWRETSENFADLASAFFVGAQMLDAGNSRIATALDRSLFWRKRALASNPFDPYGWAQLAHIEFMKGRDAQAAQALRLSLYTGPAEPRLMVARIEMLVSFLDKLPPDMKHDLPFIISGAWQADPNGLALAAQRGHFVGIVEDALRENPESLTAFRGKLSLGH